jgi:RNA polymerase sigma-70 factor (ECF subfamily)
MSDQDQEIVSKVLRGDRKAFGMLVVRYEKPIYNMAYRMVHDSDDAADITQAAFVRAYEKIESFNPKFKFFNWLYRIAVNESINLINRRKRNRNIQVDLPAQQPTPEDDFALSELSHLLQRALMAMSFDHRVVIVLKHLLFLSYREIAEVLDISEKTVKSRLFSARQVLKKQLAKEGYAG